MPTKLTNSVKTSRSIANVTVAPVGPSGTSVQVHASSPSTVENLQMLTREALMPPSHQRGQPPTTPISPFLGQAILTIMEHIPSQGPVATAFEIILAAITPLHSCGDNLLERMLANWLEDPSTPKALIDGALAHHTIDLKCVMSEIMKRVEIENKKNVGTFDLWNKKRCEEETRHATADAEL